MRTRTRVGDEAAPGHVPAAPMRPGPRTQDGPRDDSYAVRACRGRAWFVLPLVTLVAGLAAGCLALLLIGHL